MDEISQWVIAALIGTSIAAFLAWFNKSGSDFKDGFEQKSKRTKKKKQISPLRKSKSYERIPIRTQ